MKKTNLFMNLATLAVAAVIGGSLTSCSDIPTPTITDANGKEVQVTSAGGYYFTYDKKGHLLSISDKDQTYLVQEKEFIISSDDEEEVFTSKFTFDKNDRVTKIEFSGTEYEKETWEGTYGFTYDSNERLKSSSYVVNWKSLKENRNYHETYTVATNYVWSGNQMTINREETEQGSEDGEGFSSTTQRTYAFTYGSQSNPSKQLPYYMGEKMIDTEDLGAIFCVLGFFGIGPQYLPTNMTSTRDGKESSSKYILEFTQNSNGTIESEKIGYDYGNGYNYYSTFNYTYTTRAGEPAAQSFKDLVRNSLRNAVLKHREQK